MKPSCDAANEVNPKASPFPESKFSQIFLKIDKLIVLAAMKRNHVSIQQIFFGSAEKETIP